MIFLVQKYHQDDKMTFLNKNYFKKGTWIIFDSFNV